MRRTYPSIYIGVWEYYLAAINIFINYIVLYLLFRIQTAPVLAEGEI